MPDGAMPVETANTLTRSSVEFAPVFLFGFERSGTTLLTMMTGAHPRLSCPLSVTGTWWRFAARLDAYNDLNTADDIRRIVQDVAVEERLKLWNVPFDCDAIAEKIEPGRFDQLVSAFHAAAAEAESKPRWVNMDIATLSQLEHAARLFPTARFVQIVRDGRDVAVSFKTYRHGGLNVSEVARAWSAATVTADRIGTALGPDRYLRIAYEALIDNPEKTLTALCGFIGERYDPQMLDYKADVARKVPQDKRDLWPVLDRPPQTDRIGRWRHEMRPSQRYVFEQIAADALQHFGYPVEAPGFSIRGEVQGVWCWLTRGARLKRLLRRVFG